jgi:hypothetical protein
VCKVCGWCNDPVYESGVNTAAHLGPNSVPLDDARVNFARHGSIYPLVDLDRVTAASVRARVWALATRHACAETREHVEHYLGHGEHEIALEGLCIDIMDSPGLGAEDFAECIELGRLLGLDHQTVLRHDFWRALLTAAGRNSP